MYKAMLCLVLGSLCILCGCETTKNTAVGVGMTAYGFGKGAADDSYNVYKALEKSDKWFEDRYW